MRHPQARAALLRRACAWRRVWTTALGGGQLAEVLDSPEIAALVSELEATRWAGRLGYPIKSMVGMALAKSIYAVPTWTRLVALVTEHASLRAAICGSTPNVPAVVAASSASSGASKRMGARSAPRPWAGPGSAARRPDDPRQAGVRAESSARPARGVAASVVAATRGPVPLLPRTAERLRDGIRRLFRSRA
jgi:hypothetical protein